MATTDQTNRGDDDNDDWCGVCREKGDLLMCDGCCLSFHCGCIGYQDLDFLPDDKDWFCWNCSKLRGVPFAVDTRPINPQTAPEVIYMAVDASLEYYYKYNILQRKSRRGRSPRTFTAMLRTGPDAQRDVVVMNFDVDDRRIWRGDLSRKTRIGWIGTVEPAPGADLTRHPVPLLPQFHRVRELGHTNASDPPPPPVFTPQTVRPSERVDDRNAGTLALPSQLLEAADILSHLASGDGNIQGLDDGDRPDPTRRAKKAQKRGHSGGGSRKENETVLPRAVNPMAPPPPPSQERMTEAAMELDVNDDVEVWISETSIGPGGWVPGRIVERALIDEDGSGAPYFAFYSVEMLPIFEHQIDVSNEHSVLGPLMRVRRPLAVPIAGEVRYATMVRRPLTTQERHRPVANLVKGDRVEAIVCGRYAPGTVAKDTGARSSTCRIVFDNPAKEMGYKAATMTQPIDAVRKTLVPARYYGMLQ